MNIYWSCNRCDFASNKTGVCQTNEYYTPMTAVSTLPGRPSGTQSKLNEIYLFVLYFRGFFCISYKSTIHIRLFIKRMTKDSCNTDCEILYTNAIGHHEIHWSFEHRNSTSSVSVGIFFLIDLFTYVYCPNCNYWLISCVNENYDIVGVLSEFDYKDMSMLKMTAALFSTQ